MAVFLFQEVNLEERVNLLFIPNKSIYGIFVAAQTLLMMGFLIVEEKSTIRLSKTARILILVMALLNVCLLVATQSRAGWIGFAAGALFMAWQLAGRRQWRKSILLIGGSLWAIIVLCLLFYKQGSTNGRLLIYKISWKLFSKHPLFGIGRGRFKINYNLEQADYFAASGGTPKEVLLADNTIYSFSEPLQLLVENGIVGAVFLALILVAFVKICLIALKASKRNSLLLGAVASLIGIGITSLFSYPTQTLPVLLLLIINVVAVLSFIPRSLKVSSLISGVQLKTGYYVMAATLVIYFLFSVKSASEVKKGLELSMVGYKKDAIRYYEQISSSCLKDGNLLYLYGKELFEVNRMKEADSICQKAKELATTTELYRLSAQIKGELGNFTESEMDYKIAHYMIPNRMGSKYDLAVFYLSRNDTANAFYWANQMLTMQVKVPSVKTDEYRQKARKIVDMLRID